MAQATTTRVGPLRTITVPEVAGIDRLSERQEKFQKRAVLALTVLPLLGLVGAVVSLWPWGFSPLDAAMMITFHVLTAGGVTVGFHRLLTHGSFEAKPRLRRALAIAGSLAVQGSVISWVAAHRRHHAFSDKPGDPHSPHVGYEEDGWMGMLKGLWHAHVGWLTDKDRTDMQRWAPDLYKDPSMQKIDRLFPLFTIISFGAPALIGLVLTQTWKGALTGYLWGGFARIFFVHHVTWSINSVCHYYGKRPFASRDMSTNNWPLAVLSLGESWHNNHHAFPTSARHGILRGQVDPSAAAIKIFERLGWANNLRTVTEKQRSEKRI